MFDTYITPRPRTEYVTREVNVHEHRAPTDESVKILREMQDAADKARIASFELEGNAFTGHVDVVRDSAQAYRVRARAVFDLNGKRLAAVTSVDDVGPEAKEELMRRLHAEIAKVVAAEILGEGMKSLRW